MASRTKPAGGRGQAARRPQATPAARRVERIRRLLLRRGLPRVQMSLILAATGAAGFVASFAMLHLGVWRMWIRYPLAVLFAYAAFIVLLRVWLFLHGRRTRSHLDVDLNAVDPATEMAGDIARDAFGGAGSPLDTFGGGGDFGGAGAGGSWGDGAGGGLPHASTACDVGRASAGGGGGGGGWPSGLDFDLDSEGCVFFLLALALIAAGVCASLYVVYAAPLLLAEILVEGVLLSGLYRGMRRARRGGDWLGAALRRTWLPVLLTLLTFAAAGYLLQRAAPRARSIGEAFHMVNSD